MGIDPALTKSGWGIIKIESNKIKYLNSGIIKTDAKMDLPNRLQHIYNEYEKVIQQYQPIYVGIEEVYVNKNPKSSLLLSHARGVAMLATANIKNVIQEFSPAEIKKAITGRGNASKDSVRYMVNQMMHINRDLIEDESDALGAAICCHNYVLYNNTVMANAHKTTVKIGKVKQIQTSENISTHQYQTKFNTGRKY